LSHCLQLIVLGLEFYQEVNSQNIPFEKWCVQRFGNR
jgi:hypothetical protein